MPEQESPPCERALWGRTGFRKLKNCAHPTTPPGDFRNGYLRHPSGAARTAFCIKLAPMVRRVQIREGESPIRWLLRFLEANKRVLRSRPLPPICAPRKEHASKTA